MSICVMFLAFESLMYSEPSSSWTIVNRQINQIDAVWQIDYELKNNTGSIVKIAPSSIKLELKGDVSNSNVPHHGIPHKYVISLTGPDNQSDTVVWEDPEQKEIYKCREKIRFSYDTDKDKLDLYETKPVIEIEPGSSLFVRLKISHDHIVYGDYHPLLGTRKLEVNLGLFFKEVLPLTECKSVWPKQVNVMSMVSEDRKDESVVAHGYFSIHLNAGVPGDQYYRIAETPIKYDTKVRIKFKYLIARGSLGEFSTRIAQYQDTPTAWHVIEEGRKEYILKTIGRWTKFDEIITIRSDATTMAIDFRMNSDEEVGEVWVDGVSIETLGSQNNKNP